MARHESDREDLLAEATALVERVEVGVPGFEPSVVAGFRRDGSASVYFSAEPAYHFNAQGELRRAYVGGLLYKAERRRLASLERRREAGQVQLVRHDLDDDETQSFLETLRRRLAALRAALDSRRVRVIGQVPADVDVLGRVRDWLAKLPLTIAIAVSPRVG